MKKMIVPLTNTVHRDGKKTEVDKTLISSTSGTVSLTIGC